MPQLPPLAEDLELLAGMIGEDDVPTVIFETSNARLVELDPGLVVVLPVPGAVDTEETAEEGERRLRAYMGALPVPGVTIVLFDRFHTQTRRARLAHARPGAPWSDTLLVGGTPLSRALIAFFSRFQPPNGQRIRVFGQLAEAVAFARKRLSEARASGEAG